MPQVFRTNRGRDLRTYSQEYQDLVAFNAAKAATLDPEELRWRDRQRFLADKGYMLRPRYHPDWVPSWTLPHNMDRLPRTFEDYYQLPVSRSQSTYFQLFEHVASPERT